jgi:hypothetical protein
MENNQQSQADSRNKVFRYCGYIAFFIVGLVVIGLVVRGISSWWNSRPAGSDRVVSSPPPATQEQKPSVDTGSTPYNQQAKFNASEVDDVVKKSTETLAKETETISLEYGSKKSTISITPVAYNVRIVVPPLYAPSPKDPLAADAVSADESGATRLRRVEVSKPAPNEWTAWVHTPAGYRISRATYPPDTENLFVEVWYEDGTRQLFLGNGSATTPLKKKSAARRFCNAGQYPLTVSLSFSQQQ